MRNLHISDETLEDFSQFEDAKDALEAGKHVLLEKVYCLNWCVSHVLMCTVLQAGVPQPSRVQSPF